MTGPLMLIVIGILFLLNNLFPEFSFGRMWPVILIVIGLVKVVEYFRGPAAGSNNPNTTAYGPGANSSNGPLITPPDSAKPFNTRSDGSEKKEGM